MFKHIFKLIWNNRRQNAWLVCGLFVISTCLWYAVDYLYAIGVNQNRSLGFDWHHVYCLNVDVYTPESPKFQADSIHTKAAAGDFNMFMDRLRHNPSVESACVTQMHKHYVWSNRSASLTHDTVTTWSWIRSVTPDYFRVFRVHGADGSSPDKLASEMNLTDIIISERLAKKLFTGQNAVGKMVRNYNGDSVHISAICENQKYNEFTGYQPATYMAINQSADKELEYTDIPWLGVYIRVKPDADNSEFVRTFRKQMRTQLMVGNLYLENMRPMSDYRDEQLKDNRNELYTYLSVAVFFLINVFLAVLGTFWFRTQQRRSELGLRIALGSSAMNMRNLLLGEGFALLTMAFVPAIVVAWNLGFAEMVSVSPVEFTLGRFLAGLAIAYFLLLLTVIVGVWFPAKQALKIQPAEALHEE
ncbi:ABC transporter permease [uncultured Bacteroides sp.]|uniref:ABC transporter permease n=1 Tax=uncultured Bacteroides sp. TaxID=162156 RepID=UPI002AA73E25|nr:ABC transporter permease [uncultured Bacteroides sp.]